MQWRKIVRHKLLISSTIFRLCFVNYWNIGFFSSLTVQVIVQNLTFSNNMCTLIISIFLIRTSGANKVKKLTETEMEPHHRVYVEIMELVAILIMIGGMVFLGYGPFIPVITVPNVQNYGSFVILMAVPSPNNTKINIHINRDQGRP